jgi:hypothetical protein
VLSLHAGDTVVFGDQSFKLGKFLGSGNATQIFELAGEPDWVIRIPFHIEDVRRYEMDEMLHSYVETAPDVEGLNRVEIRPNPGAGYLIVSKVHGTVDGRSFLKDMITRYGGSLDELNDIGGATVNRGFKWAEYIQKAHAAGDKITAEKLEKLLRQLKLIGRSQYRQFVWDEVKQDWWLVDWE